MLKSKLYYSKGSIPYAYILPKNKDVYKFRPVVSYFSHPFKKLFNLSARAISALLKLIDNNYHFILWKTGDLKDRLKNLLLERRVGIRRRKLFVRAFDIKEFYTNLSHDEIRKAFLWLFNEVRKKLRNANFVTVPHNKVDEPRITSYPLFLPKWTCFDFDLLFEIICFDLDNIYFSVGNVLLKQRKGLPMGSPLSPVASILTAAFYEFEFLSNLEKNDRVLIDGIRYIDDILVFGFSENGEKFERITAEVLDRFQKFCYHSDLILENEPINNNRVVFLEGDLFIEEDSVMMCHKNKNWPLIREKNEQIIKRFVIWNSFCSRHIKRGIVIGALFRILVNSSSEFIAANSMLKILLEFNAIGYPWNFIIRILKFLNMERKEFSNIVSYVLCILYRAACVVL